MRTVLRQAPRGGPRLSLGLVCCLPWLPPCLSPRSSRPLVPHALPCSRGACGRRGGGSAGSGGARSGPASWPPRPRERLKPHAIDIRVNIDPVHWFLSPPCDTRSSLYLEDAATEFQVQGLELDWTKSHVGRRLTLVGRRLELSQFSRGPKKEISRTDVKKPERRQYLKNGSLVLLTRARQGMVIFFPPGVKRDNTRSPG